MCATLLAPKFIASPVPPPLAPFGSHHPFHHDQRVPPPPLVLLRSIGLSCSMRASELERVSERYTDSKFVAVFSRSLFFLRSLDRLSLSFCLARYSVFFPFLLFRTALSFDSLLQVCLPRSLVGIILRDGNYRYPGHTMPGDFVARSARLESTSLDPTRPGSSWTRRRRLLIGGRMKTSIFDTCSSLFPCQREIR